MKQKLRDIIREVEKELQSHEYGFKKSLANNFNRENSSLDVEGLERVGEFDCVYYSIKGRDLLRQRGVNANVYFGTDEHGLWENHAFLKTNDGEIIDFTPLYQTLGAKHEEVGKLSDEQIKNYRSNHSISLDKSIPLHFDQNSKSLLRVSVDTIQGYGNLVKLRNPERVVHLGLVEFDANSKKYVDRGFIELCYNGEKAITGTLKQMIKKGVFDITSPDNYLLRKILNRESKIDNYVVKFLRKVF